MTDNSASASSFFRSIIREPLLHFLVLAALIFACQAIFAQDKRELILVDAATQKFLFDQEEELSLRPLTDPEKSEIVSGFVEEEILVREAVKRGYSDSSRVRGLLLQNMRFFISGNLPEPTEEQLKAFFEENQDKFESPPSVDLDHVVFNSADAVPSDLLQQLNADADPSLFGETDFVFSRTLKNMDQRRIVQAFGGATAKGVLAALEDSVAWNGPFVSPTGTVHFLRVKRKNPPKVPEFEQVKDWIATQWLASKSREMMEEEMRAVEPGYRIEIEDIAGDSTGG
ncbi:peptidyl-prolyl cis-trans isomerase [Ruegeria sp. Alg231-54]|uniref:peptidylprolyl isomerase n=1 Tax=Ruegeria sp. Alg231-54 TaxID=1922221 RepID=UPI000D55D4F7|nr:peptidylprolyl isomerase [Ruegeria sp. Alg231-54]